MWLQKQRLAQTTRKNTLKSDSFNIFLLTVVRAIALEHGNDARECEPRFAESVNAHQRWHVAVSEMNDMGRACILLLVLARLGLFIIWVLGDIVVGFHAGGAFQMDLK